MLVAFQRELFIGNILGRFQNRQDWPWSVFLKLSVQLRKICCHVGSKNFKSPDFQSFVHIKKLSTKTATNLKYQLNIKKTVKPRPITSIDTLFWLVLYGAMVVFNVDQLGIFALTWNTATLAFLKNVGLSVLIHFCSNNFFQIRYGSDLTFTFGFGSSLKFGADLRRSRI